LALLLQVPVVQWAPLSVLDLESNRIGDQGAAAIASALLQGEGNPHLKQLVLSCNRIGPSGMASLAKVLASGRSSLAALHLGHNRLGAQGAAAVASVLPEAHSLAVLDLRWVVDGRGPCRAALREPCLTIGSVHRWACVGRNNSIGDVGAMEVIRAGEALGAETKLKHVLLAGNGVGACDCAACRTEETPEIGRGSAFCKYFE
jgi:hypothetical protein